MNYRPAPAFCSGKTPASPLNPKSRSELLQTTMAETKKFIYNFSKCARESRPFTTEKIWSRIL